MATTGGREQVSSGDGEVVEQGSFVDINVTPLVDIFLVLLVILMATSTAILEAGQGGQAAGTIPINLPSGDQSDVATGGGQELVIAIPEDGAIIVRGEQVSMTELEEILRAEAEKSNGQLVMVQADEEARHHNVVEVMEAARRAGLTNLAIATRSQ